MSNRIPKAFILKTFLLSLFLSGLVLSSGAGLVGKSLNEFVDVATGLVAAVAGGEHVNTTQKAEDDINTDSPNNKISNHPSVVPPDPEINQSPAANSEARSLGSDGSEPNPKVKLTINGQDIPVSSNSSSTTTLPSDSGNLSLDLSVQSSSSGNTSSYIHSSSSVQTYSSNSNHSTTQIHTQSVSNSADLGREENRRQSASR